MEKVDLNITNYKLNDLLKLFNLDINFTIDDLKRAKKVVMQTHPDKSKLDKQYFLFFSKAFKIVHELYEFRRQNNDNKCVENRDYDPILNKKRHDEEKELINNVKQKTNKDFNKWFNTMFEESKLSNLDSSNGYGDWLKSEEDTTNAEVNSVSDMNSFIANRKKQLRAVAKTNNISDNVKITGANIIESEIEEYSSDMFSNLTYNDLKKAHTESVIAVTDDDLKSKPKYNSVTDIQNARSRQDTAPLSLSQAQQYLEERENKDNYQSTNRAFELAKQHEESQKKQQVWWTNFKQIT